MCRLIFALVVEHNSRFLTTWSTLVVNVHYYCSQLYRAQLPLCITWPMQIYFREYRYMDNIIFLMVIELRDNNKICCLRIHLEQSDRFLHCLSINVHL